MAEPESRTSSETGRTSSGPEIELEIRPDGTVRFEVSGLPREECEALEKIVLEALGGEVVGRECTPESFARARRSLGEALRAVLKR